LTPKGVLTTVASLISREIELLNHLERVTLNSDLAQGFALKTLTDLLASFVAVEPIKMTFKGRLVSTVLHGYLSLRRLVVQEPIL
jgi:E3 ubiquitin-protein ligase UBR4